MSRLFLAILFAAVSAHSALAQYVPDGLYRGARGYFKPSGPDCLARYDFTASVNGGSITFSSDNRFWAGTINQETGQVYIGYEGVNPPPNQNVFISGNRLYSDYCGEGFFNLNTRRY